MNAKEFLEGLIDTIFSRDCLHYLVGIVIPAMCVNDILKQSPYTVTLIVITVIIVIISIFIGIHYDLHKYEPKTRKLRLYAYIFNTMSHILTITILVVTCRALENGEYDQFIITIFLALLVWAMNEDYTNKMNERGKIYEINKLTFNIIYYWNIIRH